MLLTVLPRQRAALPMTGAHKIKREGAAESRARASRGRSIKAIWKKVAFFFPHED